MQSLDSLGEWETPVAGFGGWKDREKLEGPWPTDIPKDNCVPNNSEVKAREDSLVSKMLSPN